MFIGLMKMKTINNVKVQMVRVAMMMIGLTP